MKLINTRVVSDTASTLGVFTFNGKKIGFVIEDEHRHEKVKGQTRIPAGIYEVNFRMELTPLTKKYRAKYSWFTYHLELQFVPNFSGIYIHIGNFHTSTDGCQVVGNKAGFDGNNHYRNHESTICYKDLYLKVKAALERGERVTYQIIDADRTEV